VLCIDFKIVNEDENSDSWDTAAGALGFKWFLLKKKTEITQSGDKFYSNRCFGEFSTTTYLGL